MSFHYRVIPWLRYPAILFLILLTSFHSYLLFHTSIELFSVIVAAATFMFAWNSRDIMKNNYFLFIGIAFFFISILDFAHTLTYQGMGIFASATLNTPTQLWLAGRFLQAVSFLLAPSFLNRKIPLFQVVTSFSVITFLILLDTFYFHKFPATLVSGVGLTPVKIFSEIVICLIFLAAALRLSSIKSDLLDRHISLYLQFSLVLAILTELLFSSYITPTGLPNILGHIVRLAVYYFVYKAVIEIGLSQPYRLMFREIDQINSRKDEFISTASHEIKNPLTVIKLYSSYLNKKSAITSDPKALEAILQINRQTDQINRLIGDMQDVNHLETGKLALSSDTFRMDQLVKQVLSDMRPSLSSHQIIFHRPPRISFTGDSNRLRQVITNLLTNAAKYSPPGKKIEVSLSRTPHHVLIAVRDYGPGIAAEEQPQLFNRYYRTSSGQKTASGLGLGLYLCREIVALHHGKIWVESILGHGSTFHISLPLHQNS